MRDDVKEDAGRDALMKAYEELGSSYRAIDDFRMKLFGLLPFATAAGIALVFGGGAISRPGSPRS